MPRGWVHGPQGQTRPVGTGACAVHVMRIGTGELTEELETPPPDPGAAPLLTRNGRAEFGGDRPRIYGSGLPFDGVDPHDI